MNVIRKLILLLMIALLIIAGNTPIHAAKPENLQKAAFVRNGDLWVKSGDNELQLTRGEYIRNPKWSHDSNWIAYTKGENELELWLWQVQTGKSQIVSQEGGRNFQWSPTRNNLAFQSAQQLYLLDLKEPAKPEKVAQSIGNYSWLPDGSGFMASSEAKLLPDGWTPIMIMKIPLSSKADPNHFETLYVLPKQSDDFFAVGTSIFKWSANRRWIAFLATPTASLSADSNTLCLLSADGSIFKKIDQMVNNEQWFKWASKGDALSYIGGVGRQATNNKQLKFMKSPAAKPVPHTPRGYVDQSFTWVGFRNIVASRAIEAEWSTDFTKRQFPYLVDVKLRSRRQKQLTLQSDAYGDFNPVSLQSQRLAWIRSNRSIANVMLADPGTKSTVVWIENIDLGSNYNEQWNWNTVLSFYIQK